MFSKKLYYVVNMAWQQFARDYSGRIIDVRNISEEYVQEHGNESFKCLECGSPMLSKRGNVKEWHFAHIGGKNVVCSYESYLHKLGIIKFVEAYKARIEANKQLLLEVAKGRICYRNECPYGKVELCGRVDGYGIVPLLPDFKNIEIEVKDGNFIPDVLLSADDGRKIYIEIVVTHFSEPRKIASGVPIVEIELKSEADLNLLTKGMLSQRDENIGVFNFGQYMKKVDYQCEKGLQIAKEQFVNHYRRCVREGRPLKLEYSFDVICSRKDCPYIEGHCCMSRKSGEFDLARLCKEDQPDNVSESFSPDFYLETIKERKKIRFSFCYRLFRNAEFIDGIPTVQFALDYEPRLGPWVNSDVWETDSGYFNVTSLVQRKSGSWTCSCICNFDDDVRYYNFEQRKERDLCGDGLRFFEVIVLDKNGVVKDYGANRIDKIHQIMSQIWDEVEDYILIPYKGGLGAPSYDDRFLQSLFEKDCNACLHCLDKRIIGTKKHVLTCRLNKQTCKNEDALDCEKFKRNRNIRYGKLEDYSCSYKYRGSEDIIEAWKRYRLKK